MTRDHWERRNVPCYFIQWAERTGAAARDAARADYWMNLCDRTKAGTAGRKQINTTKENTSNG
jgi:hypothetical protein